VLCVSRMLYDSQITQSMLPEDDCYDGNMYECFKCFNVNFRLLKTMYVHLLVCYLNYKVHGAAIKIDL